MTRVSRVVTASAFTVAGLLLVPSAQASADGAAGSGGLAYNAGAQAPVLQITQDNPTSTFHPQADTDLAYSRVAGDPGTDSALASVVWPGSAAANAGSLIVLLGGPSTASALNDPIQAQAPTSTGQPRDSVTAPSGTTMTASVAPAGPDEQHAAATSVLAGGGIGPGSTVGHSSSETSIDYKQASGDLTVSARSFASNIEIAGVAHIGSAESVATATSSGGATPRTSGQSTFSDFTVANEPVYVDSTGVHLGSPGKPGGSMEEQIVDSALQAAGMTIYFTDPHAVTIGGESFYTAASVLFYWAPPNDTNHDSFTVTVGGSSVLASASSYSESGAVVSGTGTAGNSPSVPMSPPSTPAATTEQALPALSAGLGASAPPPGAGLTPQGLPVVSTGTTSSGTNHPVLAESLPVAARSGLGTGLGPGWWIAAVIAVLLGTILAPRLPTLLESRAAGATCPQERRPRRSRRSEN